MTLMISRMNSNCAKKLLSRVEVMNCLLTNVVFNYLHSGAQYVSPPTHDPALPANACVNEGFVENSAHSACLNIDLPSWNKNGKMVVSNVVGKYMRYEGYSQTDYCSVDPMDVSFVDPNTANCTNCKRAYVA